MKLLYKAPVLVALLALAGCQSDSPAPAQDTEAAAEQAAVAPDLDPAIGRAILANPMRTQEARDRDPRSKPEVILGLLDLKPGDHVADFFGGSGYYTDLMASMVGEEGEVILHNNSPFHTFVEERVKPRYIDNPIPGIRYLKSEIDDLQLEPESLDAALIILAYHDLYYYNPGIGFDEIDVSVFFAQVHAALKPDGRLLIVDHSAVPGTGKKAAQHLHRIDEEFAVQDIESNGFRLVARSDALRNPEDNRKKMVFDAEFRGKTDRFILLFEKK